jgi:ABC-type hemin transport system ATPase subunit
MEGEGEQQRVHLSRSLFSPFPPVRGDTVIHLVAKLESHRICLMHKFMFL